MGEAEQIITREHKRRAIERELRFRRKVYPGRVNAHHMMQSEADYQIAVMVAILADYTDEPPLFATPTQEPPHDR